MHKATHQLRPFADPPQQPHPTHAARICDDVHPGLIDVALIDAKACAAAGGVSLSWWHDAVRTGRAPKPVVRQQRFTRWRLRQVAEFWAAIAITGSPDGGAAVLGLAQKASKLAAAKRNGVEGNVDFKESA